MVFGQRAYLEQGHIPLSIVLYLDGASVSSLASVSSETKVLCSDECAWKAMCNLAGFKNMNKTRTRGHSTYRSIYRDNLCVECREYSPERGLIKFDLAGGCTVKHGKNTYFAKHGMIGINGSKVALCSICLGTVTATTTWKDRSSLLPKLKERDRVLQSVWSQLMQKIPLHVKKIKRETISAQARAQGAVEGAQYNDHLLRTVMKK